MSIYTKKGQEDLARGLEFEEKVLEVLNNEGQINVIKNPEVKGMDLIIVEHGIEVKADHYNFHKGKTDNCNAYIEYEAYGKPSGIFKYEALNLKYWIHSLSPNEFFLLNGKRFRRWVAERIEDCEANTSLTSKGFRVVSGGDGNRTKGLLVPIAELKAQAEKIYNINNE